MTTMAAVDDGRYERSMTEKLYVALPNGVCLAIPVDALQGNDEPIALPESVLAKHVVPVSQFVQEVTAATKAAAAREGQVEGQEGSMWKPVRDIFTTPNPRPTPRPVCGVRG